MCGISRTSSAFPAQVRELNGESGLRRMYPTDHRVCTVPTYLFSKKQMRHAVIAFFDLHRIKIGRVFFVVSIFSVEIHGPVGRPTWLNLSYFNWISLVQSHVSGRQRKHSLVAFCTLPHLERDSLTRFSFQEQSINILKYQQWLSIECS